MRWKKRAARPARIPAGSVRGLERVTGAAGEQTPSTLFYVWAYIRRRPYRERAYFLILETQQVVGKRWGSCRLTIY
jgi:hypothetical protein